jgi:predicted TIM-barrel fold metal-dependent hydrolase
MIDAHHHLGPEPDYADRLQETAQALGFTRVCLVGLPAFKWPWATNTHVAAVLRREAGFFAGFAYVDPAIDPPESADRWREVGFTGLKLIRPRRAYDDRSYLPLYERAAALGMPLLFHTGMVSRTAGDREHDVHSGRMRPVALDYVARQVPEAQLIAAHLGHPWWDEAGEACRLNPNVHVDLSGPALQVLSPAELRRVFWWGANGPEGATVSGGTMGAGERGAAHPPDSLEAAAQADDPWAHVVFGSDVPHSRLGEVLARYRRAMDALGVPAARQQDVLGGNMRRLLR